MNKHKKRKLDFIKRSMEFLDLSGCYVSDVEESLSNYGVTIPEDKNSKEYPEVKYELYYDNEDTPVRVRVNYKDTYHPLTDEIIDQLFIHLTFCNIMHAMQIYHSLQHHDTQREIKKILSQSKLDRLQKGWKEEDEE